eukprot:COSAG05_NODE_11567_length_507_cov_0.691176_1_plen_60_part_01
MGLTHQFAAQLVGGNPRKEPVIEIDVALHYYCVVIMCTCHVRNMPLVTVAAAAAAAVVVV